MREALGDPKAIVPAAKTIGALGTRLMIPLGHIRAAYVRSHFSTAEMTVWDGPRRGEIAFGLAVSTGGRVHARIGGLDAAAIKGDDGLRQRPCATESPPGRGATRAPPPQHDSPPPPPTR